MTKEELKEKRNLAIENLNYAIAILGSDELYIDELEKENTELKKQYKKECEDVMYAVTNYSKQLTKAKELLERLLITSCNSDVLNLLPNCSEVLKVRAEAEQFLKDSEVEK